jgi:hypothetical protein
MANIVYHSLLVKTGDIQQVLDAARELIPAAYSDISLHDGLIKFGTKWGTPVEAFKSLAARFPDYDIIVHGGCVEDGSHFVFELHNGVAVGRDCEYSGGNRDERDDEGPCNWHLQNPANPPGLILNQSSSQ